MIIICNLITVKIVPPIIIITRMFHPWPDATPRPTEIEIQCDIKKIIRIHTSHFNLSI